MVIRNQKGWTLAELLVVVAIVGVVMLAAPQIMPMANRLFILGRTKLELQGQARSAMYVLTRELRQAQSATISVDQAASQPYYSRITFTTEQGSMVTVYQNGSNLQIKRGITVTTLSPNLAYLAFTFPRSDDMTILSVSMTLQKSIYNGMMKALHMASEQVRIMN